MVTLSFGRFLVSGKIVVDVDGFGQLSVVSKYPVICKYKDLHKTPSPNNFRSRWQQASNRNATRIIGHNVSTYVCIVILVTNPPTGFRLDIRFSVLGLLNESNVGTLLALPSPLCPTIPNAQSYDVWPTSEICMEICFSDNASTALYNLRSFLLRGPRVEMY